MRIVLLALLGMGGVLAAAIFIHYDLPLSLSQLRERFQSPAPTATPVADMATTDDVSNHTSPTPSFPVLTLNDQAMNPFIEMPNDNDVESSESSDELPPQAEATDGMHRGD
jgi:hypothetical protein